MYLTDFIFKCFSFNRFLPNFKKWCDSDKLWIIFLGRRFLATKLFPVFKNKIISQNKIFINKLLNLKIIDSFLKIGNRQVVENFFLKKMIRDLSKSHHF